MALTPPITLPHRALVRNGPTPRTTINLRRSPQRQSHPIIPEERSLCPRIRAQVEVDVRAVLVRAREPGLGAQRVSGGGTQVVDHDDDAGAGVGERVAGGVGLAC